MQEKRRSPVKETIHLVEVHTLFVAERKRHCRNSEFFVKGICSFCVEDCPSPEKLGGIFYG
jgi:hypothetical protein